MGNLYKGKEIDLSSFLGAVGLAGKKDGMIRIFETPGMYPHKEKAEDNWSYFTAYGFQQLQKILKSEEKVLRTLAIVGIGSGVEGILAAKIFKPELIKMVITDIDSEVVYDSFQNINNAILTDTILIPLIGSFCEPMVRINLATDLIYGNIPNLPAAGEDLSRGPEKGTFVPASLYEGYEPGAEFISWALGAQFAYLQSAKKVISEGGSVVTALGGRMPMDIVEKLFVSCGLKSQEVAVGFKEQTEAFIDFQGYHRLEQEYGVSFEFYLYRESMELIKRRMIRNPSSKISGVEMKALLERFKVSAGEALSLYEKGIPVGHTLLILRGFVDSAK
jgi:hypothetical protein